MRVGVIGYTGFVGQAFYKYLREKDMEVVGLNSKNIADHYGERFDVLINANGNASKRLAALEPEKDAQKNICNTLTFLFRFSYDFFVHLSSIDVYPKKDATAVEDYPINPLELSNYGFTKYMGELLVRKYAERWLIFRLGGMVGEGKKKGPVYDILKLNKLFVSSRSRYQYLNTRTVARVVWALVEKGVEGEVFNLVGRGNVELAEIAKMAGIPLKEEGEEVLLYDVPSHKIEEYVSIPTSEEEVRHFLEEWKHGRVVL